MKILNRRDFLKVFGLAPFVALPIIRRPSTPASVYPWKIVGTAESEVPPDYLCDGVNDQEEIQAAINSVSGNSVVLRRPDNSIYTGQPIGSEIMLLRGVYNISNTIVIKPGIRLRLAPSAVINLMADVDAVNMQRGSSISGGMITSCAFPGYTHSAIKLDGSEHIFSGHTGYDFPMSISDMLLFGNTDYGGNAIHFLSDELDAMGHIFGANVSNVGIRCYEYGVRLEVKHTDTMDNWITSNHFRGISIVAPRYGVALLTPLSIKVCDNTFVGVTVQSGVNTLKAFYCEGVRNYFGPVATFDTPTASLAADFSPASRFNHIEGGLEALTRDQGINKILDYSMAAL
jgi:hypothetical protein